MERINTLFEKNLLKNTSLREAFFIVVTENITERRIG